MEKKLFIFATGTLLATILSTQHYVLNGGVRENFSKGNQNILISEEKETIEGWKTYQSRDLGFELGFPSDVSMDRTSNDQYNRSATFRGKKLYFDVRLKEERINGQTLDGYHYLDFSVARQAEVAGMNALVFEAPRGYCDGPGCSSPFIAYSVKYKKDFYNLVFYGDANLDNEEKDILLSFKFIDRTKSYANYKYNYEVRYPQDWLGGEVDLVTDRAFFIRESRGSEYMSSALYVHVFDNKDNLSAEEWWKKRDQEDSAEYLLVDQAQVDGIPASRYKEIGGLDSAYIIFQKDSHIFLLGRIGFNDNVFDTFIESFKFVTQSSNVRSYLSLNNDFSFNVYYTADGSEKCSFDIKDAQNRVYDVPKLLNLHQISCSEGAGSHWSSFKSWADKDRIVLEESFGEIKIVDFKNEKIDSYQYDIATLSFIAVDRELRYWLFRNNKEKYFTLLGPDKNTILGNIAAPYSRPVLYDTVNNGFLFIERLYSNREQDVSIKLYFLSLSNMSLKNILATDPVFAPGMGCYPEELLSKPGEIILTRGCLTVDKKYLSTDGNIHVKL